LKSPNKLNRFDALQVDDENDEKQQSEININNEEYSSNDEEDNDEEEEEDDDDDLSDDENLVEPIREDIRAYEQLKEKKIKNLSLIVNREELIYLLKCLYTHKTTTRENILTIGMVNLIEKNYYE
jgi:TATA-binding protein-associated factor Taf7